MPGLYLDMGTGGSGSATYTGPVFGDGAAASVPGSGGYGDTGRGSIAGLAFGPSGVTKGGQRGSSHGHALAFGMFCFGMLLFMAWALPR